MSTTIKIFICLVLVLGTEFYLTDTFVSSEKMFLETIVTSQSTSPMIDHVQASQSDATSPFFWHFAWLGTILSICGVIGISAAYSRWAGSFFKESYAYQHGVNRLPNYLSFPKTSL